MKSVLFLENFYTKKHAFVFHCSLENSGIRVTLILVRERNLYSCSVRSDLRDHLVQTSCFTNEETGVEVNVRLMFKED